MNRDRIYRIFFPLAFLLTCSFSSCTVHTAQPVSSSQAPRFADDSSYAPLIRALQINLDYLRGLPEEKTVLIAGTKVPVSRLLRSSQVLQDILAQNPSPEELDRTVQEHFDIIQTRGNASPGSSLLVTGYFQPVFEGSLSRTAPYLFPLYGVPPDLVIRSSTEKKETVYGRLAHGRLIPYWSRKEIEQQGFAAGNELVWLKDPYDAFLVHIQGSAVIQFPDGSRRGIHFAAKNGHTYRSIGGYLIRTGRLSREKVNMQTIRDYIAAHPDQRDEIFHANPSFIFFTWTDTPTVIGSLGKELTPGRSIAVDQRYVPAGSLAFLVSRRPTVASDQSVRWSPLHRFVVAQDSGSAIKGDNRVDLFWGSGDQAGAEAGLMKESGEMYILLAKERSSPSMQTEPPRRRS